jgi:peptidoglycan/xylan/chitin deacetylase (PgdA/CDA1 family)
MLATAFYTGLRSSGLTALARNARQGGAILCYHNVVAAGKATGEPGLHLDVDHFRAQLSFLERHYDVLPLREFSRRVSVGQDTRGSVAITFDDGYLGVFDLAWPIMRDMGLPATVFVPTDLPCDQGFWWDEPDVVGLTTPQQRRLWLTDLGGDGVRISGSVGPTRGFVPRTHRQASWVRIAGASREGCEIGVHTSTHRNLTLLSDIELHRETAGSREQLKAHTGIDPFCFSYPYGLFDARVRDAVRRAGFDTAVTLEFGLNSSTSDPLALRRMNVPASISAAAFEAWVAGLRPRVGETT